MRDIRDKTINRSAISENLYSVLIAKVSLDKFVEKEIQTLVEDLKKHDSKTDDMRGDVIGSLSDQDLIDLLAEKIYLETIIGVCETKISAARWRHTTIKERFKQVICDHFDLPDDEPIIVDIKNMKVLRGDREARIEDIKNDVYKLFETQEDELKDLIRKEANGSLEADLAAVLMGDHREDVIKLCKEVFQATEGDREFLEEIVNDEHVPKPIKAIADFVYKERGIGCRKNMIIEWH